MLPAAGVSDEEIKGSVKYGEIIEKHFSKMIWILYSLIW
jgi:phosphoenolpyruvate synthase/pyruvate phosphate dikinase